MVAEPVKAVTFSLDRLHSLPLPGSNFFVRKLLLTPLRLCVGWGLSPRVLSLVAATVLVMLRLSIGWHFYSEGLDKRTAGNWSAAPFFAAAKGPLAEDFRALVWDSEGTFRLNRDSMVYYMALFREQAAMHFDFDAKQKAAAQRNYAKAVETYDYILESNAADLEEFKLGRARIASMANGAIEPDSVDSRTRDGVASLGGQRDAIRQEWQQKAAPALAQIETLWSAYEADQNNVATDQQRQTKGNIPYLKPRVHPLIDTSVIDRIVPYFDITIGLCLLVGFFTPIAGLAAAGFLFSVFLSQIPPTTGPNSTMYQLVEGVACLLLAATGAGRFAGVDYFLHLLVRKTWGRDDKVFV
jgi:uncharacterized membrane protein YphA (DoxX/SURF4 family)